MVVINQNTSFKISGFTYTGTDTQLNYTANVGAGIAQPSKALILDSTSNLIGINTLNLNNLVTTTLTVSGTLITNNIINNLSALDGVVAGTATENKVLIVNNSKNISGINSLSANSLIGTISNASQTNITTIGTLTSLTSNGNVNIAQHDGTTTGLQLNGTLVTASATELNRLKGITSSTAELNRLSGITSSTTELNRLTGLLSTTSELNLLNGVTATTTEFNYLSGVTPGTVTASKALVVNGSRDITNLGTVSTTGTITSGGRFMISASNWGFSHKSGNSIVELVSYSDGANNNYIGSYTLHDFSIATNQSRRLIIKSDGKVGINTTAPFRQFDINAADGNCLRLIFNNNSGTGTTYCDQSISATGDFNLTTAGTAPGFTFTGGRTLINNSTASTSTTTGALQILGGMGIGGAINAGNNITTSGSLMINKTTSPNAIADFIGSNTYLEGTSNRILRCSGSNISPVQLEIQVSQNTSSTSTNPAWIGTISNNDFRLGSNNLTRMTILSSGNIGIGTTTPGYTLEINGVLDVNQRLLIGTSTDNTTNRLISALDSTITTGDTRRFITLGKSNSNNNQAEITFNWVADNSSSNYLALGLHTNNTILNILGNGRVGIGITNPSYTLDVNGSINLTSLFISGSQVTATVAELNYLDFSNTYTLGVCEASKAVILNSNRDVSNIRNLTATNLTGTLQTISQPNITSLSGVTSIGASDLTTLTGTLQTVSQPNITTLSGVTSIGASNLTTLTGTLQTVSQPNITTLSGVTSIGASNATTLTGTLQTVSQPNITTLSGVTSIGASNATTLTGTLQTASQPNVTSLGTLTGLTSSGAISITNNTSSTSSSTGALRVTGGVGIGENLNIGGNLSLTGSSTFTGASSFSNTITTSVSGNGFIQSNGGVSLITNVVSANSIGLIGTSSSHALGLISGGTTRLRIPSTASTTSECHLFSTSTIIKFIMHSDNVCYIQSGLSDTVQSSADLFFGNIQRPVSSSDRKFMIKANGRIGIQTSAPDRQLEINASDGNCLRLTYNDSDGTAANYVDQTVKSDGTLYIKSSTNSIFIGDNTNISQNLYIGPDNTTGTGGLLRFVNSTGTNYIQSGINSTTGSAADLFIGDMKNTTLTSNRKFMIKSDGNVGIGTSTPTEKLEISGNVLVSNEIKSSIGRLSMLDTSYGLSHKYTTGGTAEIITYSDGINDNSIGTYSNNDFHLMTNDTNRLSINANGNITISQNLSINGNLSLPISITPATKTIGGYSVDGLIWNSTRNRLFGMRHISDDELALCWAGGGTYNDQIIFSNSSGATFNLSTNITRPLTLGNVARSYASWGLTGIQFNSNATTYTDSSGAGTITNAVINSFGQPTITSTNTRTITNAATVYIHNSPSAGANTTFTNSYALWAASGRVLLGSSITDTVRGGARLIVNQTNNSPYIRWTDGTAIGEFYISSSNRPSIGTNTAHDLGFYTANGSANQLLLQQGTGNIGMGTSTPQAYLDFGMRASDSIINLFTNSNGETYKIGAKDSAIKYQSGTSAAHEWYTTSTTTSTGTLLMRLSGTGDLGIGTNSPAQKLHVSGTTRTNSLVVGSNNVTSSTTINGIIANIASFGSNTSGASLDVTISFTSPSGSAPICAMGTWRKNTTANNDAFVISTFTISSTSVIFRIYRVDSATKTWNDGQSFNYIIIF